MSNVVVIVIIIKEILIAAAVKITLVSNGTVMYWYCYVQYCSGTGTVYDTDLKDYNGMSTKVFLETYIKFS